MTAGSFTAMVAYDYSKVVIRPPGSLQAAVAIRGAISGVGHWSSIDIERARELLERREYTGICVGRVGGRGGRVTGGWGGRAGVPCRGRIERKNLDSMKSA